MDEKLQLKQLSRQNYWDVKNNERTTCSDSTWAINLPHPPRWLAVQCEMCMMDSYASLLRSVYVTLAGNLGPIVHLQRVLSVNYSVQHYGSSLYFYSTHIEDKRKSMRICMDLGQSQTWDENTQVLPFLPPFPHTIEIIVIIFHPKSPWKHSRNQIILFELFFMWMFFCVFFFIFYIYWH